VSNAFRAAAVGMLKDPPWLASKFRVEEAEVDVTRAWRAPLYDEVNVEGVGDSGDRTTRPASVAWVSRGP
jgi:hypothetical protein